jgi:hypothetical protein
MDQNTLLNIIIPTVSNIAVSIFSIWLTYFLANRKTKKEERYQKETDVILKALNFIDKYCSWLTWFNEDGSPLSTVRNEEDTIIDMTEKAREINNLLILYCKDSQIVNLFYSIVLGEGNKKMDYLYSFRNCCRKELGFKENIDYSKSIIYIGSVSTEELNKNSQKQK